VERVLEEVGREFSGLPVYVGVEEGYVKRTAPTGQRQFRKYLETCRRLGFRFDGGSSRWRSYSHLQRYRPAPTLTQPQQAGHPNSTYAPKPGARHCEEWRSFPPFFSSPLSRGAEEWRVDITQRRV